MPYGRDNPLTREAIAERIADLDKVNGVLISKLCYDTADMLRALLPFFGESKRAYHSISNDPRLQDTWRFTLEVHLKNDDSRKMPQIMQACRAHLDYLLACDAGDRVGPASAGHMSLANDYYTKDIDVLWLVAEPGGFGGKEPAFETIDPT